MKIDWFVIVLITIALIALIFFLAGNGRKKKRKR